MAKWTTQIAGDFDHTLEQIRSAAGACGDTAELVEETGGTVGDCRYAFLVYEKYFYRSNSYASLSIQLLSACPDSISLAAIAAAAGGGLLNLDWGAANAFLKDFQKRLDALGQ